MTAQAATDVFWIRHAPTVAPETLAGRRDVAADVSDSVRAEAVRRYCGEVDVLIRSPAQRCAMTAATIWPEGAPEVDARLWEQDFGAWDGMALRDLPDLGPLPARELAAHRPPQGESFLQVADRIAPVLVELPERNVRRIAIVAHAGVIRAALGRALGEVHAGLGFAIAPWSVTHLSVLKGSPPAIVRVNWEPLGA
ncbi:histidine phosphatase family protein [Pseudaestuariivita sp.]|uniref:histidine phosphatase family protein n=1 Tax=Pseudaestuariivita sp. TaxID=2211669 RepID=UPI004058B7F0